MQLSFFFCINTLTRAWIIALGIRSRLAKYRRNNAGKDLFYCITSIINRGYHDATDTLPLTPFQSINRNNPIIKTNYNSSQSICANHADIHGALINCRSVVNKTEDIKLELVNTNLDLGVLMETWIKEGDTITSTRLCPDGYKSSIPRHDRVDGGMAIIYKGKFNSTKPLVNHIIQWNPLALVSRLVTGYLISLQYTGLWIPIYWSSVMNSPIYLNITSIQVVNCYY